MIYSPLTRSSINSSNSRHFSQKWYKIYETLKDEDGLSNGRFFTGEIATEQTKDHVTFLTCGQDVQNEALANLILAAKDVYDNAHLEADDHYTVYMDTFFYAFEAFVMKCAGW